jgi:hypothetical protein
VRDINIDCTAFTTISASTIRFKSTSAICLMGGFGAIGSKSTQERVDGTLWALDDSASSEFALYSENALKRQVRIENVISVPNRSSHDEEWADWTKLDPRDGC